MDVFVTSGAKGSNPGGKVRLSYQGALVSAYLKHCYSNKLSPEIPLTAINQPFYEALTYEMAKSIGVVVPEYVVLNNTKRDLTFIVQDTSIEFSETFPYFFVSFFSPNYLPNNLNDQRISFHMKKEKLDREILFLADIENKAQNYYWDSVLERLVYNDLGCNFVHAVQGFLQKPTGISAKEYTYLSRSERRKSLSLLQHFYLDTLTDDLISLRDFIEKIPYYEVRLLNPKQKQSITSVLTEAEVQFITDIYTRKLVKIHSKFIGKGIEKIQ